MIVNNGVNSGIGEGCSLLEILCNLATKQRNPSEDDMYNE